MKELIRHACANDKEAIIQFIKDNWSKDHVFVRRPDLFDYQHYINGKLHYVISEKNSEITAILGYFPYSEIDNGDVALALLKKDDLKANKIVGTQLIDFVRKQGFSSVVANGIRDNTKIVYRFLRGYEIVSLDQYYVLNPVIEDFKIALINERNSVSLAHDKLKLVVNSAVSKNEYDNLDQAGIFKDYWYYNHRYVNYPYFNYIFLNVYDDDQLKLTLISRECTHKGSKVLRIVDFIGDLSAMENVQNALIKIIIEGNYEYLDFYYYGSVDVSNMNIFTRREKDDKNIIPNYFEPFEQRNIDICSAVLSNKQFHLCKADSDQDRPNLIEG